MVKWEAASLAAAGQHLMIVIHCSMVALLPGETYTLGRRQYRMTLQGAPQGPPLSIKHLPPSRHMADVECEPPVFGTHAYHMLVS